MVARDVAVRRSLRRHVAPKALNTSRRPKSRAVRGRFTPRADGSAPHADGAAARVGRFAGALDYRQALGIPTPRSNP